MSMDCWTNTGTWIGIAIAEAMVIIALIYLILKKY